MLGVPDHSCAMVRRAVVLLDTGISAGGTVALGLLLGFSISRLTLALQIPCLSLLLVESLDP